MEPHKLYDLDQERKEAAQVDYHDCGYCAGRAEHVYDSSDVERMDVFIATWMDKEKIELICQQCLNELGEPDDEKPHLTENQ